jgi:hypothetical protein
MGHYDDAYGYGDNLARQAIDKEIRRAVENVVRTWNKYQENSTENNFSKYLDAKLEGRKL